MNADLVHNTIKSLNEEVKEADEVNQFNEDQNQCYFEI